MWWQVLIAGLPEPKKRLMRQQRPSKNWPGQGSRQALSSALIGTFLNAVKLANLLTSPG
jgi:hypothetical protein